MIRVLLAENHTMVRKGLKSLIEKETTIKVVGEANNGQEVLQLVEKVHPHVIVMDISMPILNGIDTTMKIKKQSPNINILMLSRYDAPEYIFHALKAGASGYLVKKSAPSELIIAIQSIYKGESYLSSCVSKVLIDNYTKTVETLSRIKKKEVLSDREIEVLKLLTKGNSTKELAKLLYISVNTVATHRRNIMKKLNVHSISQLIRYAIRAGIIDIEEVN